MRWIIFILLAVSFSVSNAQNEKLFDSYIAKADSFNRLKNWDSVIYYGEKTFTFISTFGGDNYQKAMLNLTLFQTGDAYQNNGDVANAHRIYSLILRPGNFQTSIGADRQQAFIKLNELHRKIRAENIRFNYPEVKETEEMFVNFKIDSIIRRTADSVSFRINAGSLDGLSAVGFGQVYSAYEPEDTMRSFALGQCRIINAEKNYSSAIIDFDSAYEVRVGDIVELKVRFPSARRDLDVLPLLQNGIFFTDNRSGEIYNYRYLYYYGDSAVNDVISLSLRGQLEEVSRFYAKDSAKFPPPSASGFFRGQNLIRALKKAGQQEMKYFLSYVKAYPRVYYGPRYKFSEVFATWIINNTPLNSADIAGLLMGANAAERSLYIDMFKDDIRTENLLQNWFDRGMIMAGAYNSDSVRLMTAIMRDAIRILKDSVNDGWDFYLEGFNATRTGEFDSAAVFLRHARNIFLKNKNAEGGVWAAGALRSLAESKKVELTLQTGHIFNYVVAPSANPRYFATGGYYDKFIKLWDVRLGKEVRSFKAHEGGIRSLQYSENGRYLMSTADDSTIKIWNAYDYSLLYSYKQKSIPYSAIFADHDKKIIFGGSDSLIKIAQLQTGKVLQILAQHKGAVTTLALWPRNPNLLFSGGTDSMVYKWNLSEGKWIQWYKEGGKILNVSLSSNGNYLCDVSNDTTLNLWDVVSNKRYGNGRVNASKLKGGGTFAVPAFSPDSKLIVFANSDDSISVVNLSDLKSISFGFKSPMHAHYDVTFSRDGSYLIAGLNLGGPLRLYNFADWHFRDNAILSKRDIKTYYSLPLSLQFTPDDNQLALVHDDVSTLDLKTGATNFLYSEVFAFQNSYILLNDTRVGIHTSHEGKKLNFYDYVNRKIIRTFTLAGDDQITHFELSADNKLLFIGGAQGTLSSINAETGEVYFNREKSENGDPRLMALRYDSIRKVLIVINRSDTISVIDIKTGALRSRFVADEPATAEVSSAKIYVTCAGSYVYEYDPVSYKLIKKIKVHKSGSECYGSVMSPDYKYLAVQVADKFVTIDTRTDKVLYEKYDHDYENAMMTINHAGTVLASGGFDSKVNLYKLASGEKIASVFVPRGKDFLISDPEGRYLSPKLTTEAVSFSYGNANYGFEQFDTRFNRPDIILAELGRADKSLINSYYGAWQKRLKLLGVNEKDLPGNLHLPVVHVKQKFAVKPSTTLRTYPLDLEFSDAGYPLRSYRVSVNGNPMLTAGESIIPGNVNTAVRRIIIPLAVGVNNVKITCTNAAGAVSLSENLSIVGNFADSMPPKTYFIGIAVSNYKDSTMSLRYPVKDVRDLAESFGKIYKRNFEADTLINENVTKENILALREKLMHTTVNDKVIISINGHGLLNDSLDFYYGTYDVNFRDPAGRGIKYETLEALLSGIPARKKLMLIDACHSGALDKEELLQQQKNAAGVVKTTIVPDGAVQGFAARGMIVKNAKSLQSSNNSFEIMQNLFSDVSEGNGAVIISAAGGMEYAFESDKWNNGVFTYCVRKGIEEEQADKDGGDENELVDVAELKTYVSKKVAELTKGKQRPVSRRENIDYNWIVW